MPGAAPGVRPWSGSAPRSAARRGRSLTTDRRRAAPRRTRREGEGEGEGAGRAGRGVPGCRGVPGGAARGRVGTASEPPRGHREPFPVRRASKAESVPRCGPSSLCRWVWRRRRRARGHLPGCCRNGDLSRSPSLMRAVTLIFKFPFAICSILSFHLFFL